MLTFILNVLWVLWHTSSTLASVAALMVCACLELGRSLPGYSGTVNGYGYNTIRVWDTEKLKILDTVMFWRQQNNFFGQLVQIYL